MLAHIFRRIAATIPVMVIVALFVFSLLYIAPGDPAAVIAGEQASPEDVEKIRRGLGLDRPFLSRFGDWSWHILQGDLGTSMFTGLPVTQLIVQRLEPTLSLMVVTLILSVTIAVPMGVMAAWKAGTWVDRALIARITRASMLEVLQQDYIRTARSKGMGQSGILFVHALKNAAVPIVTVIGIGVALLIGGAVVTESVFAIPGLGRLTIDAIVRRDYPVIQGIVLLFSLIYVLVNLAVDVIYTLLDPRIRY